jgi:putative transcriptional regulator
MESNTDMTETKRYLGPALRSLHEAMEDLHQVGAIDKVTMRDFDLGCLTPVEPLAPEAIKQIRDKPIFLIP